MQDAQTEKQKGFSPEGKVVATQNQGELTGLLRSYIRGRVQTTQKDRPTLPLVKRGSTRSAKIKGVLQKSRHNLRVAS